MIKITKQILLLVIILLIIVGFYFGYNYFLDSKLRSEAKRLSERELYINTKFSGLVDKQKLKEGFWYVKKDSYGNEDVAFFDPNKLTGEGFSDEDINNIYLSVKGSQIFEKDAIRSIPEQEFSQNLQTYNAILVSPLYDDTTKYMSIKDRLVELYKTNKATKDDLIQLSYLYTLEAKYNDRDLVNKKLCSDFEIRCTSDQIVDLYGVVFDNNRRFVENAKITVFSDSEVSPVFSDENGAYKIPVRTNELSKIRLKVTKKGYSDAVVNVSILYKERKKYKIDDAILVGSENIFTLDTIKKTISGEFNKIEGDNAIVKTSQSTYTIPMDVFFDKNGESFSGKVEIITYEFNRDTVSPSMVSVDTFDTVRGYAGNIMETAGMPYIQFFDKDGKDLYVKKSRPIKISNNIYHMDLIYSGKGSAFGAITEKDVEVLINFCKDNKGQYPITQEYLVNNNLLGFPAWWIFDQSRGVWDNVGFGLINREGLMESIFYTIKDVV